MIRAIIATVLAMLVLNLASVARAQDDSSDNSDAIAKATQLNKDALAAFQAHKIDEAKRLLKQALDLCDASGLDQHPIKARTLVHFGMVLIGGPEAARPGDQAVQEGAGDRARHRADEVGGHAGDAVGVRRGTQERGAAAADTQSDAKPTPPDTDATPARRRDAQRRRR